MKSFYLFLTLISGFCLSSCYDMMGTSLDVMSSTNSQSTSSQDQSQDATSTQPAPAKDTVYLKDGSIIHGTIIEEVPGVSLKLQKRSGNVMTYQMSDVQKITHSMANDNDSTAGDDSTTINATPTPTDSDNQ